MKLLQNQAVAFLLMLVMIVAGIGIGSYTSLNGMRNDVLQVFANGIAGDGIGVQNDLNERSAAAYNMVAVARRYLPEDNVVIQAVLKARQALEDAVAVEDKLKANKALDIAVKDLFQVLSTTALSVQDARYPEKLYSEFRSRGDTISHDPYNQMAASFNEKLGRFPANALAGFTGVSTLALFR